MLDAFIIEQLKKIERQREQERRPRLELPYENGRNIVDLPPDDNKNNSEKPCVIIIDYGN